MLFSNDRYITSNAKATLPLALQVILWKMIEEARQKVKLDYLQVFRLQGFHDSKTGKYLQRIIHVQEQPPYENAIVIDSLSSPVTGKVFVIDDGPHSTMLMAEDY